MNIVSLDLKKILYNLNYIKLMKNTILLESNPDFSDNTKGIFDKLIEKKINTKCKIIWFVNNPKMFNDINIENVYFIRRSGGIFRKLRLLYYLMFSKYIIDCNKYLPKLNKNQFRIHLTHGAPLKNPVDYQKSCGQVNYIVTLSDYFSEYYCKLPTYVYLKTQNKNILLAHAGIPRDIFLHAYRFDETDGHIRFEPTVPETERLAKRKAILKDMIWGDPKDYDEKMQVEGRFEFGRKQFERFYSHNHIELVLRSHEEAPFGYKSFFDNRLYTIFSTGGDKNPQTGYPGAEPAFAIIQGDALKIENSFLYQCLEGGNRWAVNLFSSQKYFGKGAGGYQLSEEFVCEAEEREQKKIIFKEIRAAFPTDNFETVN